MHPHNPHPRFLPPFNPQPDPQLSILQPQHPRPPPPPPSSEPSVHDPDPRDATTNYAFLKGPKRKRLAKACDACHKSKRRCDGTAPCSNCYFASKDCTYTDAAGRPVPAPRASKPPEKNAQPASSNALDLSVIVNAGTAEDLHSHHPPVPPVADEHAGKRRKFDLESQHPQTHQQLQHQLQQLQQGGERDFEFDLQPEIPFRPTYEASRLDPSVVRELVNLFFAHCQPYSFIIHKPTFSAALSHDRVPCFLLHTICALAAPLSHHPAVRAQPPRAAGNPYAQEARAHMFDRQGRLAVPRDLVAVQALCILQSHELSAQWPWTASTQLFVLALKILQEDLHVHEQSHPILTPVPSAEFVFGAIDRECARRAFWLIRFMHLTAFTYYYVPIPPAQLDLSLRLPIDETSFELAVHSTLSEYLHIPAPQTQYASEFGHLMRIVSIHWALESTLRAANAGSTKHDNIKEVVHETERALSTWEASLADHIQFSEESMQLQLSMFETGSNSGAWAYFLTHITHATCVLALLDGKSRIQAQAQAQGAVVSPSAAAVTTNNARLWARERMMLILTSVGQNRCKKLSFLAASALVPLFRYDLADTPQVQAFTRDFEAFWGARLAHVALHGSRSKYAAGAPPSAVSASADFAALHDSPEPAFSEASSRTSASGSRGQRDAGPSSAHGGSAPGAGTRTGPGRSRRRKRPWDAVTGVSAPPQFGAEVGEEGGANGGGVGNGNSVAGGTSLPGLKACGLLDPWSGNGTSELSLSPSSSTAAGRLPPPPWTVLMGASAAAQKANSSAHAGAQPGPSSGSNVQAAASSSTSVSASSSVQTAHTATTMMMSMAMPSMPTMPLPPSSRAVQMSISGSVAGSAAAEARSRSGSGGDWAHGSGQGIGSGGKASMPVGLHWLEQEQR